MIIPITLPALSRAGEPELNWMTLRMGLATPFSLEKSFPIVPSTIIRVGRDRIMAMA